MFEQIVLRRSQSNQPISAGEIAQALLFYQKVHLFLERQSVVHLIKQIGPRPLLDLLRRPDVSAVYSEELLCVVTNTYNSMEFHSFAAFTTVGFEEKRYKNSEDTLRHDLARAGIDDQVAKAFASGFLKLVPIRKLSGKHYAPDGLPKATKKEVSDSALLHAAAKIVLSTIAPKYKLPDPIQFDIIDTDKDGFVLFNNLDWQHVDSAYENRPTPADKITPALVLEHIQQSISDMMLAAHYGGYFITSSQSSRIAQTKYEHIAKRAQKNSAMQTEFFDIVLPEIPSIAQQIDSGDRNFPEFLKLMKKAQKFKNWLGAGNPDEGLVREYIKSQSKQDWTESFPTKMGRFLFTSWVDGGLAAGNPLDPTGPAGAFDSFLFDRIFKGWRPNHFIEDRLKPFLRG
ncbi:hypothetical protein [Roseateles sp. LYH14W]|uniref:Uncharacterized protein n=1 Tax=Pelomonas parva TaxID=3299032 RepID=A0ABW7F062_9BURK